MGFLMELYEQNDMYVDMLPTASTTELQSILVLFIIYEAKQVWSRDWSILHDS